MKEGMLVPIKQVLTKIPQIRVFADKSPIKTIHKKTSKPIFININSHLSL